VEEEAMPFIRVNCPKGAHSSEHKATLAPRPVQALIRQEIDLLTEIGTAATGFFFNELDVENWRPGGVPLSEHPDKVFWI
jgi:phenylpyruvate tautomerase PptA (4-oxalocrotonate tautomerase family)